MSTKKIESASIISQATGFLTSDIDGETVMMSIEKGKYFGLDAVGSRIWDLLESPTKLVDLINSLVAEFEVDPKNCELDVLEFLERLNTKGMLRVQVS